MSLKGQQPIMKKLLALSIATVMCLGIAGHAFAGANPNMNLAVDVQAKAKARSSGSCNGMPTYSSCSVINQVGVGGVTGTQEDVIFVAYRFTGMTGIEFGVNWGTTYFAYGVSWTKCSDFEITGQQPTSLSAALTWSTCKVPSAPDPGTGGIVVGWMRTTMFTQPGVYHITPAASGALQSLDCAFQLDDLHTVHDGFSNGASPVPGTPGALAPCEMGPTATATTTWSGVKALYR